MRRALRSLALALGLAAALAAQSVQLPLGGVGQTLGIPLPSLAQGGASSGQCLIWNGSAWAPATCATGGGAGNVSGPGSSTAGYVPAWNNAFGTLLNAGMAVSQTPLANALIEATSGGNINPAWLPLIPPTQLSQGGASSGQCLIWNGSSWAPAACVTGASGTVNGPGSSTSGYLATWGNGAGTLLAAGLPVSLTSAAFSVPEAQAGGAIDPNFVPTLPPSKLSSGGASSGQCLIWNGSAWAPATCATGGGGGNVSGPGSSTSGYLPVWGNGSGTLLSPGVPVSLTSAAFTVPEAQAGGAIDPNFVPTLPPSKLSSGGALSGQCLIWNGSNWAPATCATGGGGGGGGASMASQLGDLQVISSGSNTLLIGQNCSIATPCSARFGGLVYSFTSSYSVTMSGTPTGNVRIYFSSAGTLYAADDALHVTCSSTCIAATGVGAFPADSIPLANWHATSGAWDSGTDLRAMLSARNVYPGLGLISSETGGNTTLAADPSLVGLRAGVPGSSSAACTAGTWAMDSSYRYDCVATNTWRRTASSSF